MTQPTMMMPITIPNEHSLDETTRRVVKEYLTTAEKDPSFLHRQIIEKVEQSMICFLMEHNNYNQSLTARYLGVNRMTLRSKLKRYGMIT